jgi:hypothetical protein
MPSPSESHTKYCVQVWLKLKVEACKKLAVCHFAAQSFCFVLDLSIDNRVHTLNYLPVTIIACRHTCIIRTKNQDAAFGNMISRYTRIPECVKNDAACLSVRLVRNVWHSGPMDVGVEVDSSSDQ